MKQLTAIVLLLWTACYMHCSAEQFGLVDCEACECQCGSEDSVPDSCPDSHDGNDAPCGVCEFLMLGGAPTVSPLVLDAVQEVEWEPVTLDFRTLLEWQELESDAAVIAVELTGRDTARYVHLYPFLAGRTLPARGPNV